MQPSLKIIISGGGTGGHIFPAIAIANAIKQKRTDAEILFIGALGRMEMKKIPEAGYPIKGLPIAGLQRTWSLKNFLLPFKVMNSVMQARSIIREFKPDATVGVGGYASAPVLFASTGMKVPSLIQEQNSYAGITNKMLGKRVKTICVAYEGMEKFFPKEKIVLTGNPVRKDILNITPKRAEAQTFFNLNTGMKTLLVIGGSLGAGTINESIRLHLEDITKANIQLIWQAGKGYYAKNAEAAQKFSDHIHVYEFIDRMDLAYAAADVVISRAGAISIAELCVTKKACVLVPSPNVAEDHQTKNALALVQNEAALVVADVEAQEKLVGTTMSLMSDHLLQEKLKTNIALLAKPNADDAIAEEVLKMIDQKNRN